MGLGLFRGTGAEAYDGAWLSAIRFELRNHVRSEIVLIERALSLQITFLNVDEKLIVGCTYIAQVLL